MYLHVVSVVVGAQVDVGCPCGCDNGKPLRQVARPEHGVQEVVPPAVSLQKAAQPLVSAGKRKISRYKHRARAREGGKKAKTKVRKTHLAAAPGAAPAAAPAAVEARQKARKHV